MIKIKWNNKNARKGALAGAGTGSMIGSVVPGVGNVVGGVVGGVIGGVAGGMSTQWKLCNLDPTKGLTPKMPNVATGGVDAQKEAMAKEGAYAKALAEERKANPTQIQTVGAQQGSAATVNPNSVGNVSTAGYRGPIEGQTYTTIDPEAARIAQLNEMQAAQIGGVRNVRGAQIGQTAQVQAAQVAPVERVDGQILSPAAQAQAAQLGAVERVQGQTLEQQQQAELRQKQLQLAQALELQAAGQGPSVAEDQLRKAQERAIKTQMALAASSTANPALAARQAALNIAEAQQVAGAETAALRIQEQKSAQEQLANVAGTARTQDIGVASEQAKLAQEAALSNQAASNVANIEQAKLTQEAGITNVQAQNVQAQEQARLAQEAALSNQAAQNVAGLEQAKMQQQAAVENAAAANNAKVAQAKLTQEANLANQAKNLQVQLQQAQLEQDAAKINKVQEDMAKLEQAKLDLNAAQFNAEAFNRAAEWDKTLTSQERQFNETIKADISKFSAGQMNAMEMANMENKLKADVANQQAKLQAKGMDDAAIAAMMGLSQDALNSILTAETGVMQAKLQRDQAKHSSQNSMLGSGIGAVGAIAAAYFSDKRVKENINKLADKKIAQFLNALNGYEYDYKDTSLPGTAEGRRFGIMIQDIEKTPMGKSLVKETEKGKMIDIGQGLGTVMAGLGHINKRLNQLEGGKVKGKVENVDSYENDTELVKVAPGEIIVPVTVAEASKKNPKLLLDFVKKIHEEGQSGSIEARNPKAAYGGLMKEKYASNGGMVETPKVDAPKAETPKLSTEDEEKKRKERKERYELAMAIKDSFKAKDIGDGISSAGGSIASMIMANKSSSGSTSSAPKAAACGGKVMHKAAQGGSVDKDQSLQDMIKKMMEAKKKKRS